MKKDTQEYVLGGGTLSSKVTMLSLCQNYNRADNQTCSQDFMQGNYFIARNRLFEEDRRKQSYQRRIHVSDNYHQINRSQLYRCVEGKRRACKANSAYQSQRDNSLPFGKLRPRTVIIKNMTSEATRKRMNRNVQGFAPASYPICAKIAFVPKQAADSATRNTPTKRSI